MSFTMRLTRSSTTVSNTGCIVQGLGGEHGEIERQLIEGMDLLADSVQSKMETKRLGLNMLVNNLVHTAEDEVENEV